jgi:branched-chain amino acid aminotransferase
MLTINDNNARYVIIDSSLEDTEEIAMEDNVLVLPFDGTKIYEVIRYIDGEPLFLEDHYKRLVDSANTAGIKNLISMSALREYGKVLLEVNSQKDCNLKFICAKGDEESYDNFIVYLSKFYYPEPQVYKTGVETRVVEETRENPNAKISRKEYIDKINEFKAKHNIYEAILKNDKGFLTEGSKSNLFFVKGDTVYTAPPSQVLVGTMRKYVLKACENNMIPIKLEAVHHDNISEYDAAFLTGTSIKVLPIVKIDEVEYKSSKNEIVLKLTKGLEQIIKEYYNSNN